MEYYLEELNELIEDIDGEDTDWSKELTEDWDEESDEEGDEKWGDDFSEL